MRIPITMRRTWILLLATIVVAAATACGLDPGGVRVQIDGEKVAPDRIHRMPVDSAGAMAASHDQQVYVRGMANDPANAASVWPIYRNSPEGDWEVVVRDSGLGLQMRGRPGTTEVYAGTCQPYPGQQIGPLKLHRVTDGGGLADVSDDFWGGLSPQQLSDLEITGCPFWAIAPDGAVLLATSNQLLKVLGRRVEVVLGDVSSALGLPPDQASGPIPGNLEIRVGQRGEVLLYYPGPLDGGLSSSVPTQPVAFLLVGTDVEPVQFDADYSIRDAAIGPDGAAYFLVSKYEGEGRFVDRVIRVSHAEQSEITRSDHTLEAISIDSEGRLYLVYGDSGDMFNSSKWWLLGFPTEDIIGRPTPSGD